MAAIRLSSLGASGAPAPAASILWSGTQTSASATVTQSIPAGTYSVVSDFPCLITINSVPFFIQGGASPTIITVATSATSFTIVNLSLGLQNSVRSIPTACVAIAWNGTVFVALPAASGAICYTSPDGITWTSRTMPASTTWAAVAWNGTVFCAMPNSATNTTCATSPDGITWTARTCQSGTWQGLAWNGTVFCTVSSVSGTAAQTSPDGITWTARTLPATASWIGVMWNGTQFYAWSTTTAGGTSPDGTTWTSRTGPTGNFAGSVYAVAWGNNTYVAINGSQIPYTSPDGITWTARSFSVAANSVQYPASVSSYVGVIFQNGVFIIGASNSTYGAYIGSIYYLMTSPDGVNWAIKQVPFASNGVGGNGSASNGTIGILVTNSAYCQSSLLPNPVGIYAPPATTI